MVRRAVAEVLKKAGLKPQARYAVLHCADTLEYASADGAWRRPSEPGTVREAHAAYVQLAAAGDWGGSPTGTANGDANDDEAAGRKPIRYYESIDLFDAFNPQTILAYDLNGKALPVSNGAPLRLRVERQLGYKNAKYVMRVEMVSSLAGIGDGKGGYWEDRGYEWYAGFDLAQPPLSGRPPTCLRSGRFLRRHHRPRRTSRPSTYTSPAPSFHRSTREFHRSPRRSVDTHQSWRVTADRLSSLREP